MMKLYKIMFLNTMMYGTLISISSYSWLTMWMGLEINLLSIIPLFNSSKNIYSSEASLKYFITQALMSLILLFSIIMMLSLTEFISPKMNFSLMTMMNLSLLTKMGTAPFHFWFIEVMEGLNWLNCLLLLTWQKIAPMILLMNNKMNWNIIIMIMILSLIISGMMSFNQNSLRKILTLSSINHIAWMLTCMMISFNTWMIYFLIYSINSINLIFMFKQTNSFYIQQIFYSMNKNKILKFTLMLNFFSLAGIPPLLGFFPKWLVINWMIINKFYMISFILIIFTLIMTYIYIRIMFSSLMINHNEINNKININNFLMMMMNLISIFSLIFLTLIFNYC